VGAAEVLALRLHAVADDERPAGRAARRHHLDGAREGGDDVALALALDRHRLVVVVPAHLAPGHGHLLGPRAARPVPTAGGGGRRRGARRVAAPRAVAPRHVPAARGQRPSASTTGAWS